MAGGGSLTGAELEYKSDYYDEIMAILKDNIHLFEKIYDRYPSTETIEQDKRLNKLVLDNLKSIHNIALQSREKLLSFSKKNDATAKAKGVYEYAHGGSPEADMDDDGVTRGFFEDEAYTYAGGGNLVRGKKFMSKYTYNGQKETDFLEIIDTKAISSRIGYNKPVIKAKVYYSSVPDRVGKIQEFTKEEIKSGLKHNFMELFAEGGTMGEMHRTME